MRAADDDAVDVMVGEHVGAIEKGDFGGHSDEVEVHVVVHRMFQPICVF